MAIIRMFYAGMLAIHVRDSGIIIPQDADDFDPDQYPHWQVFTALHIGRAIEPATMSANAAVIAKVPYDEVREVTYERLIELGLRSDEYPSWD